jgi:adenosine kinase
VYVNGEVLQIPAVPVANPVDPTGCGDALRSGLLFGIENGLDWPTTGRLGSLMGAIKIASQGPQNHTPSLPEIQTAFKLAFGYSFQ